MGSKLFISTFSSLLFLLASPVSAAVFINEFSSSSDPEWIELCNDSESSIDLSNWTFKDKANHSEPISGILNSHGYFVFERREGWLNNSGEETLTLFDNSSPSAQIDSVTFGNSDLKTPSSGKCAYRYPDGGAWISPGDCTKGSANPAPPTATPLPPTDTPVPTHTPHPPTPTHTPKPPTAVPPTSTPRPNPTSTSRPTIKPTIKPTLKPTLTLTPPASPSAVLGIQSASPEAELIQLAAAVLPAAAPTSAPSSPFPFIVIAAGVMILVGAGVLFFFRR